MIDAAVPGYLRGRIATAVVNHQPFNGIESFHASRQVRQGLRQGFFLIVARNLNYQFHRGLSFTS